MHEGRVWRDGGGSLGKSEGCVGSAVEVSGQTEGEGQGLPGSAAHILQLVLQAFLDNEPVGVSKKASKAQCLPRDSFFALSKAFFLQSQ